MKKIIFLIAIIEILIFVFGPSLIVAEEIITSFSENSLGNSGAGAVGAAPVVKAKWEMQGPYASLLGTDDMPDAGAQFLPSGQYQVNKPISVCAVVTDADGMTDIDSVYNYIFYPMANFGPNQESGRTGCGQEFGTQCLMTQLVKEDGYKLLCDTIQNSNSNLPTFYDFYTYNEICAPEGELMAGTAYVYCCDRELSYDDVSGDYKVQILAKDKTGQSSNVLENIFTYLELTAFEVDFSAINYGDVSLNSKKIVTGDLIWNEPKVENQASVRNTGNTRLHMTVSQNDMGLGKTDDIWNIRYGAKVGSNDIWKNYWPEETILLDDPLNLSETAEIDFSTEVLKFLENSGPDYTGKMVLDAQKFEHLTCAE